MPSLNISSNVGGVILAITSDLGNTYEIKIGNTKMTASADGAGIVTLKWKGEKYVINPSAISVSISGTPFVGTGSQLAAQITQLQEGSVSTVGATTSTDLEFLDYSKGIILPASDGTRARVTLIKNADNTISLNLSDPL